MRPEPTLSVQDVARAYAVRDETVLRWVRHGVRGVRLPAVFAGGKGWRVLPANLDAFLAATTRSAMVPDAAPGVAREFAEADCENDLEAMRSLGYRV